MHYIYSELELKKYEKCIFPFNFDMLILDTIMEGTVSQNFDLGPRFFFYEM